ncbi:hypothetical protein [Sporosarcina sp. Marseille-Q4943]|uniref:hypothetical protein n=1 Tax=Sporosarcina sp. Marseille-Q4943 TaxID=2942204 RepID=UPI00208DC109|nr:hypothetical protein [Sporosarcina sp. Marseille-Q4943]
MTSWNGLLRKEWVLMRYSLVTFIVVFFVIAVSSFAPMAVGGIMDGVELTQMFSMMLMLMGASFFLHSLHIDMKQPDVWLHSPYSIVKLLGVKAFMSILFVLGGFIIWSGIGVGAFFIGGFAGGIPGLTPLLKMLVNTLFFISAGLLIWVIYKILEIRIGWLAAVISLIPISIAAMIWGFLIAVWETMDFPVSSIIYIIVSIVLFAGGAVLLDKKVRY